MINYIKKIIISFNNFSYPFLFPIISCFAYLSKNLTTFCYGTLFKIEWHRRPYPEWMDHDQDLNYLFPKLGKSFFFERGVLPKIFITSKFKKKINILDLCCGDGFYSQFFFGKIINNCILIDRNSSAIERSKKRLKNLNFLNKEKFTYIVADIIEDNYSEKIYKIFNKIKFDLILFNAAIEHFDQKDLAKIFDQLKPMSSIDTIVFGYTLVEKNDENKFDHHKQFFRGKEDLKNKILPFYANVKCYESIDADRHNLYFIASDNFLE